MIDKDVIGEVSKKKAPLLPDRYPQQDFFVCDILDAAPKDDLASMEHPIFSLSTKPDTRIRVYEHNENSIQIAPSVLGLATIHDKDVLIYCISQLMAKINRGEEPSRTVHLKAYDLLVSTNRDTGGAGYSRLKAALERLAGTRITTNIMTNNERKISGFGLIDEWDIIAKDKQSERMVELSVTLSEWMYRSIIGKEVLTINRDYFRLRKPLERRVYEIARKHCGKKSEWTISLSILQKKCGSKSDPREFRRMLKELVEFNHLPDYFVRLHDDNVVFINRNDTHISDEGEGSNDGFPILRSHTYEKAKEVAPGYDIYYLEEEWLDFWVTTGKPEIRNPDAAFIAFCSKRYERKPNP